MSSRSGRLLVVALLAATVIAPGPARAESAKDAYGRGLSLYAAGKFQDAADAFLAAYRLKPKPLILFNVGQAFRKQGDLDQALVYYRRFLDEASPAERAPLEEETRKYVHELEAEQALKKSLIDKADTEEANKLDFPKKSEPPPAVAPPATPPATTPALTASAPAEPPHKQPVYKAWWLWTAVGAVAAGVAIGVGVGVGAHSNDPSTALGTRQPSF
jgi:tetratricopeptide (TPR) repeat protein